MQCKTLRHADAVVTS